MPKNKSKHARNASSSSAGSQMMFSMPLSGGQMAMIPPMPFGMPQMPMPQVAMMSQGAPTPQKSSKSKRKKEKKRSKKERAPTPTPSDSSSDEASNATSSNAGDSSSDDLETDKREWTSYKYLWHPSGRGCVSKRFWIRSLCRLKPELRPEIIAHLSGLSLAMLIHIMSRLRCSDLLSLLDAGSPTRFLKLLRGAVAAKGEGMFGLEPDMSNIKEVAVEGQFDPRWYDLEAFSMAKQCRKQRLDNALPQTSLPASSVPTYGMLVLDRSTRCFKFYNSANTWQWISLPNEVLTANPN